MAEIAASNEITTSIAAITDAAKSVTALSRLISGLLRVQQKLSDKVSSLTAERDVLQADLLVKAGLTAELQSTRESLDDTNRQLAAAVDSQEELERRLFEAERQRTEAERLRAVAEENLARERNRLAEFEEGIPRHSEQVSSPRAARELEPVMGAADQQAVGKVLEHADRLLREEEGNLRQLRGTIDEPGPWQEEPSTILASVPVSESSAVRLVTPIKPYQRQSTPPTTASGPSSQRAFISALLGAPATGRDDTQSGDSVLRPAVVNVARHYLQLAKTRTPAEMEALIWSEVSLDGADHRPSCAAFASLTLELAAQATGQQSWASGGDSYPWPLHSWADVRVDPNPVSFGITSVVEDAQAHDRWHPLGDGYVPQPGDWALSDEHVEVVTSYSDGVLRTIGANSAPNFSLNAHGYSGPLAADGVQGFVDNGHLSPAPGSPATTATPPARNPPTTSAPHGPSPAPQVKLAIKAAIPGVARVVMPGLQSPAAPSIAQPLGERLYSQPLPISVRKAFYTTARTPISRAAPMYKEIANQAGISWELLAACDWMQCRSKSHLSPVHGERLGTVNADGTVYRTKTAALAQCATDLIELAFVVYGIDLTVPRRMSVQALADVFAAFRWGDLLHKHRLSSLEFPYSVEGLTERHVKMRWPAINEPSTPDKPGTRLRMPFGAVPVVLSVNYRATV
ncbi:MAG TPA: hypothetical protein VI365_02355 [Trebonia sp.]